MMVDMVTRHGLNPIARYSSSYRVSNGVIRVRTIKFLPQKGEPGGVGVMLGGLPLRFGLGCFYYPYVFFSGRARAVVI